jgi:hypothetical protein
VIEVRLFGDLRRYAGEAGAMSGVVLQVRSEGVATVGQVLADVGIPMDEVGNVFLNGQLLPRSLYPISLGYPLAASVPLSREGLLSTPVKPGDRLGIFPEKMALVVV